MKDEQHDPRKLFALERESLTSEMKRLKLGEKAVTLRNDFSDKVCRKTTLRKMIEFKCEHQRWNLELAN